MGLLFPARLTNNIEQIFTISRELNDVQKFTGQIYGLLGIIELQKINNWSKVKGKYLWINATLEKQKEINNSRHLCFQFMTSSLNDLLNFSLNLIDNHNQQITFKSSETKISLHHLRISFKKNK